MPDQLRAGPLPHLDVVRGFADRVLALGADRYGDAPTPLFVDGVDVDTHEPAVWRFDGQTWVLSNFANQQNLLRTLVALSALTGEARYRASAEAATRHMFEHQRDASGLLYWGGHQVVDLCSGGHRGLDANCHEFKNTFPFYTLLWEVDPAATRAFIHAYWNAHVLDWQTLDMNRHGDYGRPLGRLWDHDATTTVEPFFEGKGLTFINAGTDLIYAAAMLHQLGGDARALAWAKRLAGMYVAARHPATGLGAYQYSRPTRHETPPADGPLTSEWTMSWFGDRAENQFGAVYGAVAREGWALLGGRPRTIYVANALVQMYVAERLGEAGAQLLRWTVEGLKAFYRYGYDRALNHFRPMWADGTNLANETISRTGYYGREGQPFKATAADGEFLLSYARAYRLSGDERLWEAVRSIAAGLGLGDVGAAPGQGVSLNFETDASAYHLIFALLEMGRAAEGEPAYLRLAERIADNLLRVHVRDGWFVPSAAHVFVRFDTPMPLALLALEATRRGQPELVPTYIGSRGYTHGRYDGYEGRVTDTRAIWSKTR